VLIEYQIRFEKAGLTISQRLEPAPPPPLKKNGSVQQNSIAASIEETELLQSPATPAASQHSAPEGGAAPILPPRIGGAAPILPPRIGGGGFDVSGATPITIIGPIVIAVPPMNGHGKEE
jgi:hypothetical protein